MKQMITTEAWTGIAFGTTNAVNFIFDPISTLFDSCYRRYTIINGYGVEQTVIKDLSLTEDEIEEAIVSLYDDRYLCKPYFSNDPVKLSKSINRMHDIVESVIKLNMPKYLEIIQNLGYTYDPIYNYEKKSRMSNFKGDGDQTSTTTGLITSTSEADATNKPTVENYRTQYNDTDKSGANLESYQTQDGKTISTQDYGDGVSTSTTHGACGAAAINSKDDPYGNGLASNYIDEFGGSAENTQIRQGDISDILNNDTELYTKLNLYKSILRDIEPYIFLSTWTI